VSVSLLTEGGGGGVTEGEIEEFVEDQRVSLSLSLSFSISLSLHYLQRGRSNDSSRIENAAADSI